MILPERVLNPQNLSAGDGPTFYATPIPVVVQATGEINVRSIARIKIQEEGVCLPQVSFA